ncbi:SCO family protein [Campylobacter curvus]|uniref:SCO family protein n=1 Tax=Campylobacter curvus TaxID=200 RepID=UPI0014707A73|nr:SCO family protein [Campylobacter curvus]
MKKVFGFLVFLLICGGALFLLIKPNKYDFIADSANGQVTLKNFDGKYKAIYFGFLFCPDVCPTTLSLLGEQLEALKRDDFELIFVTLDPERDTPENLTLMAQNFYKNSIGLKMKNLAQVTKHYGVKFKKVQLKDSALDYSIAHSSSIYLLDKEGKFFSEISNLTKDNIKENLQNMIKERP